MKVYFSGMLLGFSMIMALGPQNIFLIRQGALKKYALLSAVICFLSDALLMASSVTGLHQVLEKKPYYVQWLVYFGTFFLLFYGIKSLKNAFNTTVRVQVQNDKQAHSKAQIIALALGFSLLNPHAIIDALVLIGGGSAQFPDQSGVFLFGVLSSSLIWFTMLTFAAYSFSERLAEPKVWRRVECLSGVIMIYLAYQLAGRALAA